MQEGRAPKTSLFVSPGREKNKTSSPVLTLEEDKANKDPRNSDTKTTEIGQGWCPDCPVQVEE